jgi:hypothetical protein
MKSSKQKRVNIGSGTVDMRQLKKSISEGGNSLLKGHDIEVETRNSS